MVFFYAVKESQINRVEIFYYFAQYNYDETRNVRRLTGYTVFATPKTIHKLNLRTEPNSMDY